VISNASFSCRAQCIRSPGVAELDKAECHTEAS